MALTRLLFDDISVVNNIEPCEPVQAWRRPPEPAQQDRDNPHEALPGHMHGLAEAPAPDAVVALSPRRRRVKVVAHSIKHRLPR
jgi:hypothetical protein